ncbi:MAG: sulfotransferase [Verrucomicrobiota bacterium]
MSWKVKVYTSMPTWVKTGITDVYMALRKFREARVARFGVRPPQGEPPRVVYLTGFPRSGTTMLKYYFGTHEGLKQTPFDPAGFFRSWDAAGSPENEDVLLVDKSNHYLYALENLFAAYGDAVRVCVIIRDPRDCLVSCTRYRENREVPRDVSFWSYWYRLQSDLDGFIARTPLRDCLWVLRYEDLVRFPEHCKTAYLQWLGFDVEEEDIDRRYTDQHPGDGWSDSVHDYREVNDMALQKWTKTPDLPDWASSILQSWQEDPGVTALMRSYGYTIDGFEDLKDGPRDDRLYVPFQSRVSGEREDTRKIPRSLG